MKRLFSVAGAAVLAAGLLGAGAAGADSTTAQERAGDPPSRQEAVAHSQRSVQRHPGKAHLSKPAKVSVTDVVVDADGDSHVRYKRTYRGLAVIGGDFIVHNAPDGSFKGMSVHMDKSLSLDTRPSVSEGQARRTAREHFEGSVDEVHAPKLKAFVGEGEPSLAWEVLVTGTKPDGQTPSKLHVLVDAHSAQVLGSSDEIKSAGDDRGVYVGTVDLSTTDVPRGYELKDPARGNGYTCDMNNRTKNCKRMYDKDDAWGTSDPGDEQSAAVDAHYGAAKTFDYFKEIHGRCGIFGDCRGVPSRVHFGDEYVNAFWNGSSMTYGDGRNNANPLTSLDVAGHEMSHGVTEATAGLCYTNADCGGLNEATSDIFGSMVEFYANNQADTPDYEIGEEIDIFGIGEPLRYMYQPSLDGRSYDCWQPGRQADPHYTSGPGNHFFFLLAEGSGQTEYGTSPTCNASTVEGIGREKAQNIWFTALSTQFTSQTTYPEARAGTLAAAADLYGTCSPAYQGVQAAWDAVSVPGDDTPCRGNNGRGKGPNRP